MQKIERGVATGAYTVEHQSTGLECSHWIFWLFMGSVSFCGIIVTKIFDKKHLKEGCI